MFGFGKKSVNTGATLPPEQPDLADILASGAYRRLEPAEVQRATELAQKAFPQFAARISCFGSDWLGRMFATDNARAGEVLMLEPGTGEALEIPVSLEDFHDEELPAQADAAIAYSFYRDWLSSGGQRPQAGQCISYRQPLFLGGRDDMSNLECCDFEVYWSLMGQILAQNGPRD